MYSNIIMSITLNINEEDYPEIYKLYKKDRTDKIKDIFNTGYNIHFPNIKDNKKEIEYYTILQSIEDMKHSKGLNMDTRLNELLESIHKLTGIGNNSSKKGEVGENMIEEIINQRYGDITYENKAKTPHSGDAWLYLPNKKLIMLESKNYTYRINKEEVEKMENDMKTNHIRFGIFISWNSIVQNRKDIDIHTFNHNNEVYMIIIISNLSNEIIKLDLGLQIIRKLEENFSDMNTFPWIIDDINKNLNELDIIIKKNYKLRDNYYLMSTNIKNSMDMFYTQLRDYQYEINNTAQSIIDKVKSTMNKSITAIEYNVPDIDILSIHKDNPKIVPILTNLIDIFTSISTLTINKVDDSLIGIKKSDEEVGYIKIQKKKILFHINKLNVTIELEPANYSDSIQIIPELCKNI